MSDVFHCSRSSFDGLEHYYRPKAEVKVDPKVNWGDFADVDQLQALLQPRIDAAGRLATEWERYLLNECLRLGCWRIWFIQWPSYEGGMAFLTTKVFPPWGFKEAQALARNLGEHVVGLSLKRWLLMPEEQFLAESGSSPNFDVVMEMRRVMAKRCRRKCG